VFVSFLVTGLNVVKSSWLRLFGISNWIGSGIEHVMPVLAAQVSLAG
jgi:hypothetical protein